MWALYLYAAVAGAGILSLPSFGAWFQSTYRFRYGNYGGGDIIKAEEQDCNRDGDLNWWDVNLDFERKHSYDMWSLPAAIFVGTLLWPALLGIFAAYKCFEYSAKVLALPGKAFVKLAANKKEHDKFLTEAKREVELLCASNTK